jgi:hypothetical protein
MSEQASNGRTHLQEVLRISDREAWRDITQDLLDGKDRIPIWRYEMHPRFSDLQADETDKIVASTKTGSYVLFQFGTDMHFAKRLFPTRDKWCDKIFIDFVRLVSYTLDLFKSKEKFERITERCGKLAESQKHVSKKPGKSEGANPPKDVSEEPGKSEGAKPSGDVSEEPGKSESVNPPEVISKESRKRGSAEKAKKGMEETEAKKMEKAKNALHAYNEALKRAEDASRQLDDAYDKDEFRKLSALKNEDKIPSATIIELLVQNAIATQCRFDIPQPWINLMGTEGPHTKIDTFNGAVGNINITVYS